MVSAIIVIFMVPCVQIKCHLCGKKGILSYLWVQNININSYYLTPNLIFKGYMLFVATFLYHLAPLLASLDRFLRVI